MGGLMRGSFRCAFAIAVAATVATLAACDDGTSPSGPPAAIVVASGNDQQATVGTALPQPVVVRVVDASDRPVVDALVTFVVTSGGGSVALGTAETDEDGHARDFWTLGTSAAVAQTVEARIAGSAALLVATFSATATPGAPTALAIAGGNSQTAQVQATLPAPLAVRVLDQYGNSVPGVAVTFAVISGGGTLSATSATSNADGIASVSWTLGTAGGSQSVSATSAGTSTVTFTASATSGPATKLVVTSQPTTGRIGSALDVFVVQAADAHGNAVALQGASIGVSVSAGSLTGTFVRTTDALGRAQFFALVPGGATGPRVFTFTPGANSLTAVQSTPVDVAVGEPHNFFIVSGNNQTGSIGSFLTPPVVRVTDSGGNAVSGITVTFTNLTGNTSVAGGNTTTNASGEASPSAWQVGNPPGPARIRATMTFPGKTLTLDIDATVTGTAVNPFIAIDVAPVDSMSCALDSGGAAYCWSRSVPTPSLLGGGLTFSSLGKGEARNHVCALTSAGAAYCWGENTNGQLGNSSFSNSTTPVAVAGGLTFSRLAVGEQTTCGLTTGGGIYCWGSNVDAALGRGTTATANESTPATIASADSFYDLAAGDLHFCALRASDSTAVCWGSTASRQAGFGGPVCPSGRTCIATPGQVASSPTFKRIFGGSLNSCGVTAAGDTYCWGRLATFGPSSGAVTTTNTPTRILSTITTQSLAIGNFFMCALTASGTLYCRAVYNFDGEAGNGTNTATDFVIVSGDPDFSLAAAAGTKACAIETPSGHLRCWGRYPGDASAARNMPTLLTRP
jgi:alpha-tubulin suppressor-like RCC1 family protein